MSCQHAKGAISRQMFNLHFSVGINSFLIKRGSQPKALSVNPSYLSLTRSGNSATTERADEGSEFLHNFPHCTELEIL